MENFLRQVLSLVVHRRQVGLTLWEGFPHQSSSQGLFHAAGGHPGVCHSGVSLGPGSWHTWHFGSQGSSVLPAVQHTEAGREPGVCQLTGRARTPFPSPAGHALAPLDRGLGVRCPHPASRSSSQAALGSELGMERRGRLWKTAGRRSFCVGAAPATGPPLVAFGAFG